MIAQVRWDRQPTDVSHSGSCQFHLTAALTPRTHWSPPLSSSPASPAGIPLGPSFQDSPPVRSEPPAPPTQLGTASPSLTLGSLHKPSSPFRTLHAFSLPGKPPTLTSPGKMPFFSKWHHFPPPWALHSGALPTLSWMECVGGVPTWQPVGPGGVVWGRGCLCVFILLSAAWRGVSSQYYPHKAGLFAEKNNIILFGEMGADLDLQPKPLIHNISVQHTQLSIWVPRLLVELLFGQQNSKFIF